MRDLLLVAWLALLGATRVDFLGGSGPLVLTPFLVLSPVVIASELLRLAERGWEVRVPRETAPFFLAVGGLLALLLASTFLSYDLPTSARRFALLSIQVSFVLLIGVAIADRPRPGRILAKGAAVGLVLFLLFDLLQAFVWIVPTAWPEAAGRFVDLVPGVYLVIVPRLTGVAHDPNLGGLLVVFYLALLHLSAPSSRNRSLLIAAGVLAIALTLSRSAVLAGLVLWVVSSIERGELAVSARAFGVAAGVAAIGVAAFLLAPLLFEPLVAVGEILSHRLRPAEGSASEHALLIQRAWEVGTEDLKRVFLGIGYGNAYVTVQDIFPGNEYGNFHSLLLTLFAEAGAPAALLMLWIFLRAFGRGAAYRPLIAALFVYNLFQQAHTDPLMWASLMFAWTGVGFHEARSEVRK